MVNDSDVILAVGAHPDDIELGCGGTLYKASKRNAKVIAVFMTKGEKSNGVKSRIEESTKALGVLRVKDIHFGDFPDTEIPNSFEAINFLEKSCRSLHLRSIPIPHKAKRPMLYFSPASITSVIATSNP